MLMADAAAAQAEKRKHDTYDAECNQRTAGRAGSVHSGERDTSEAKVSSSVSSHVHVARLQRCAQHAICMLQEGGGRICGESVLTCVVAGVVSGGAAATGGGEASCGPGRHYQL